MLARIQTIHEESIVVSQMVRSAVMSLIKSHRTPAQHKTVSDAYINVVRNHLGLFNLIYNEEAKMIYPLLDLDFIGLVWNNKNTIPITRRMHSQ